VGATQLFFDPFFFFGFESVSNEELSRPRDSRWLYFFKHV